MQMQLFDFTFDDYMQGCCSAEQLPDEGKRQLEEYLVGYWANIDNLCAPESGC